MESRENMISTKDLSYIEDMFNWNFTATKKIHCYMEKVQNEEIKNFFENLYEGHKNICETLINMLNMEENNEQ